MGIKIQDVVFEGRQAWYIPKNISAVVEIDENGKRKILSKLPCYGILDPDLYFSLVKVKEQIYIAPSKGNLFLKINLLTSEINLLNTGEEFKQNEKIRNIRKFGNAIHIGNEIYFIGVGYPGIAVVNIEEDSLLFYEIEWNFKSESNDRYFARSAAVVQKYIYVPLWDDNKVLIFDTETKQYSIKIIGKQKYVSATYDGKKMWLIPSDKGKIIIWNLSNDKIEELEIAFKTFRSNGKYPFYNGIFQNGYVWIFPMQSNVLLKVNIDTYEITILDEIIDYNSNSLQYVNIKEIDSDRICGIYKANDSIHIINTKRGTKQVFAENGGEYLANYIEAADIEKNGYLIPEDVCRLDNYISMICNEKINAKNCS